MTKNKHNGDINKT